MCPAPWRMRYRFHFCRLSRRIRYPRPNMRFCRSRWKRRRCNAAPMNADENRAAFNPWAVPVAGGALRLRANRLLARAARFGPAARECENAGAGAETLRATGVWKFYRLSKICGPWLRTPCGEGWRRLARFASGVGGSGIRGRGLLASLARIDCHVRQQPGSGRWPPPGGRRDR